MKRLTKTEIVEVTGVDQLETLIELEILFTTVNEIDSLTECMGLKRFSMIDNGLQVISNLWPVSNTLLSLCLCDQAISVMSNLELPNLQELFLHRNVITKIEGLHGCPRLKKLWLCQNNISTITDMHNLPELEELFLQANLIPHLTGLESNIQLCNLGLAGNIISEFEELHKLSGMNRLTELSLNDIHFGRCPIVDESGYKDFVATYLTTVRVLDGVSVSKETANNAEIAYFQQLKSFDDSLRSIEEEYRVEIQRVDNQLKSRESHSSVLEKEMTAALSELQGLVNEGREVMTRQSKRQETLLDKNMKMLDKTLGACKEKAESTLNAMLALQTDEHDLLLSYFCKLERVAAAETIIVTLLSEIAASTSERNAKTSQSQSSSPQKTTSKRTSTPLGLLYQSINPISPEYLYLDTMIGLRDTVAGRKNSMGKLFNGGEIEVAKLYRVLLEGSPDGGLSRYQIEQRRADSYADGRFMKAFTIMTVEEFQETLCGSANAWNMLTPQQPNRLFCSTPGMVSVLNDCAPECFYYDFLHELKQSSNNYNSNSNSSDASFRIESMQQLQYALQMKLLLIVSCWIDLESLNLSIWTSEGSTNSTKPASTNAFNVRELSSEVTTATLTKDKKQRIQILSELYQCYEPQACHVIWEEDSQQRATNSNDTSANLLISIPCNLLTSDADGPSSHLESQSSARLDLVSICIYYPPFADGSNGRSRGDGIRDIEGKLESLAIPFVSSAKSSVVIDEFEREIDTAVKKFTDFVLEEMDDAAAAPLMQSENAIAQQEALLRKIRDEVEFERRKQDSNLRDLRNLQVSDGPSSHNGHAASSTSGSKASGTSNNTTSNSRRHR